jgi:2-oxo-4-hydroxy-4-carboxy-5-ureidoimidazoline decarboxylase
MNGVLEQWNRLPEEDAVTAIVPCCGSRAWAAGMAARRPFADVTTLLAASDETWSNLTAADWMEAFLSHPRIGESRAPQSASARSADWSTQEQRNVVAADESAKIELAEANWEYEQRFHHIFIVCANGKSAHEILEILRRRLQNGANEELREAAEQQRQITRIRLTRWLSE